MKNELAVLRSMTRSMPVGSAVELSAMYTSPRRPIGRSSRKPFHRPQGIKTETTKGERHEAHCKHVGNAHSDRLLGVAVALCMLGCVRIFLLGAAEVELFPPHTHDANECLCLEVESGHAHHASCKSGVVLGQGSSHQKGVHPIGRANLERRRRSKLPALRRQPSGQTCP